MKIAILLPYKEDYTPKYSGAVSIHVSNLIKYSKFKNTTTVFGNTEKKNFLSKNFFNIKINSNIRPTLIGNLIQEGSLKIFSFLIRLLSLIV